MIRRGVALSLVLFVYGTATARPEAVAIDHKAVGCIVVGKYPKMSACFTPPADLARSRVYFRPEGVASWYYVDMKSDQPCFTGTLPKPGKTLVGKKIEYYVEAQNKAFEPARTAEFDPIVVKSAQECKKNVPVAPFLNNATVAVFPAVPAGFVGGGIGTAAVVGIVGAGAAAAGTAAVVATSNNNDTTTTTVAVAINTTTTLAPTTTTTTTVPKTVNKSPFAVLTTNPDPPSGDSPLTVTFNMCASSDPDGDPLSFFFDFGDGSQASGSCSVNHTYVSSTSVDVRAAGNFEFSGNAVDPSGASATRSRTVVVQPPPPPTTTTTTTTTLCPNPTITLDAPKNGACIPSLDIDVAATATGAPREVRFDAFYCAAGCGSIRPDATTTDFTSPYSATLRLLNGPGDYLIQAIAFRECRRESVTTPQIQITAGCSPAREVAGTAWSSDLAVDGGRLQVVINGGTASFPGAGRSIGMARLTGKPNRVEATLVDAAGKPGSWRFDLMGSPAAAAGSIRVITGEVGEIAGTSVTFRLAGKPGERVVFEFLSQ